MCVFFYHNQPELANLFKLILTIIQKKKLYLLFFVCEAVFLLIETFKQKHIMTNILS